MFKEKFLEAVERLIVDHSCEQGRPDLLQVLQTCIDTDIRVMPLIQSTVNHFKVFKVVAEHLTNDRVEDDRVFITNLFEAKA